MAENPAKCLEMGSNARELFERQYSADKNYDLLIDIYKSAIDASAKRSLI
jgi:hypothetical protein